ncbi:SusC/RagA family TonB-linked outer membrane protein [Pontibacter rugosus]|uniref:SusC/RagA family TonB-linked outer membrane protein n=1 Tax=Pontibacter rugosus TaxID=1745966 RepID=A0ABW3SQZ5_9BACT
MKRFLSVSSSISFPLAHVRGWLFLFVFFLCQQAFAVQGQLRTISGRVTSDTNMPLEAVSINVKGTGTTAFTDAQGQYTIAVPGENATLQFFYMGYGQQEIAVGNQGVVNVTLTAKDNQLEEVVVVGYGNTNKRNITGSVASVSPKEFNQGVISSPAQLLQGKVPGLNITRSGDPNATPAMTLRGPSTLRGEGAQEPFYVIDGVPGASIDLVAPDDIVSIDVLRDASSTAIYGSRAANGVIMVTTRRSEGGKPRVSYSAYVAVEEVSNRIEMLTGDELRAYLDKNGKSLAPTDDQGANTDWQDEVTRTGISHNHNLSFGGSSANTLYSASVNYLKNEGIMKGSELERIIGRLSLEQKVLNERLTLGLSISNSSTEQDLIPAEVFPNMLRYLPTVGVRAEDGSYTEDLLRTGGYFNPVSLIDNNIDKRKVKTLLATGRVGLKIFEGLDYNLNVSVQNEDVNRDIYRNRFSALAQNSDGIAIRSSYTNTKKILESFFNYEKGFNDHFVKLLAGYSWQEDRTGDGFQTSNQGFVTDALSYNNLGLGDPPAGFISDFGDTRIQTLRMISFYARANYEFRDKYLFQVTVRRDGSSAFGENSRWGTFPAFSAGWRISQENFLQGVSALNDLKLRVGYGITGNSIGFNPLITLLRYGSTGRFYYDGKFVNAIGPTQNDNPDLKWERTAMANLGLDFAILNNRISGSVDVYDKRTSDLIWDYDVSTTQYFVDKLYANVGEMRNQGIEAMVNVVPVSNDKFTWTSSFNIAHNKNEIVSLSNDKFTLEEIPRAYLGGKGQSGNPSQRVVEGQPIGAFYTWKYMGKDESGVSQFLKADGTLTTAPSSDDFVYTGSAQPKLLYGWSNTFSYGNVDLNFFLRGVSGNKIINATLADLNSPSDALNHNIPRFTLDEPYSDINAFRLSDRYIEDGSYLRLDNATIGYTFKNNLKIVDGLRLYFTANNLFILTDYRGIDPEVSLGGIEPGIDNRNYYPKTRSYIFGLNVNF